MNTELTSNQNYLLKNVKKSEDKLIDNINQTEHSESIFFVLSKQHGSIYGC